MVTATGFNTTFTSDQNAYLTYDALTVYFKTGSISNDLDGTTTVLPGGILTVPSNDLRSYRGNAPGLTIGNIYSFNFADLLPNHVPILAYEGTLDCEGHYGDSIGYPFCQTIVENLYAPNLVYPTQFYDIYPQFSNCDFDDYGLYDPPTYLIPVDILTPTIGNTITTLISPGPVQTTAILSSTLVLTTSSTVGITGNPTNSVDSVFGNGLNGI